MYTSYPASRTGTGVVVGFEMFGLTGYVRRIADRLAALGHLAIVPDFYHRFGENLALPATAEGREQGIELLKRIDRTMIRDDVEAAVDELRAAGAQRIGGLGLSVGGHFLFYGATQTRFDVLATLYPGWLTTPTFPFTGPEPTLDLADRLAAHETRTLVLVGADDQLVDPALIESALAEANVDHEVVVYPDTPHGYFCDERDTWRPGPAADTWVRLEALLARNVRR